MLKERVEKALNEQVNAEMYSSYLYLAMAAYFTDRGLNGFAKWFEAQATEEALHGMKIYRHIQERGGRARLMAIQEPQFEWESTLAVFRAAQKHEQYVTGLINGLVDLAQEEKDHATNNFLVWFVDEQVEEEDSVGSVVNQLELIGDQGNALFFLDKELGQRPYKTMDAVMGVMPE